MANQMYINVNGSDDPWYRYKMPPIAATQRGGGNGKTTVVTNAAAVAHALRRDTAHVMKHLALASSTSFTQRSTTDFVLKGWHSQADLQTSMRDFIGSFVLCSRCQDPGTQFVVTMKSKKSKKCAGLELSCGACGESFACPAGKLATYIANSLAAGKSRSFKQSTDARMLDQGGDIAPVSNETDCRLGNAQPSLEPPTTSSGFLEPLASPEPQVRLAQEPQEASDRATRVAVENALFETGTDEQPRALERIMSENEKEREQGKGATPPQLTAADIVGFALEACLEHGRPLRPLWCTRGTPTPLARLVHAHMRSSKKQTTLLKVVEAVAERLTCSENAARKNALHQGLAGMMHAMYETDVLEERVIIAWASSTRLVTLGEAAGPMVKWLKEADEDASDSD